MYPYLRHLLLRAHAKHRLPQPRQAKRTQTTSTGCFALSTRLFASSYPPGRGIDCTAIFSEFYVEDRSRFVHRVADHSSASRFSSHNADGLPCTDELPRLSAEGSEPCQ